MKTVATTTYRQVYRSIASMALAFALLFAASNRCAAQITPQDMERLHIMEDSMLVTADSMFNCFLPDLRLTFSERFARQLVRTLKIPNSYLYPFDTLQKLVNVISPDDKAFRVFNWEITPSAITKRYYGAIQMPEPQLKLYGLLDYTEQLSSGGTEDSILSGGKWLGGIIYRIMPLDVQGQNAYLFFSMNAAGLVSKKKVLDPMAITERGPVFGAPIFAIASPSNPRHRINRFVLEYKKDVQVSMNWDRERGLIVFDHLVSQVNDPNRKYTYVPSGQYDGLRWANDSWNYVQDLVPVTILQDGEAPNEPPVNNPKR